MQISRDDRVRMERAHVAAWPALHTENIDGWLWRSSGGGSHRANSVSTVDFFGNNLVAAIERVEGRYRDVNAPVQFQTFDETAPHDLAAILRDRGYHPSSPTLTLIQPIASTGCPVGVERHDRPTDEWLDVYLGAITPNRRAANAQILARVPEPLAFFSLRRNGIVVSTALAVLNFHCVVIECVATRAAARRQGAARDLLAGLQAWAADQDADLQGLQVAADNRAALDLYQQIGFRVAASNVFWLREEPR